MATLIGRPLGKRKGFMLQKEVLNKWNFKKNKEEQITGRRIIDISFFGQNFDNGCHNCCEKLQFKNMIKEITYGLCSKFYFNCLSCNEITTIDTSPKQNTPKQRTGGYSVNCKAAIGMIHAGIGETHVNAFLTTMAIPPISFNTLKKRERDIGPSIEQTAQQSCRQASIDELNLTLLNEKKGTDYTILQPDAENGETIVGDEIIRVDEMQLVTDHTILQPDAGNGETINDDIIRDDEITFDEALQLLETDELVPSEKPDQTEPTEPAIQDSNNHNDKTDHSVSKHILLNEVKELVNITVSQDASWTRRGRAMNSLSGWGHAIGNKTRRCLNFSTRVKYCNKCNFYKRMDKKAPPHNCRKNWHNSAKAMEADIAVQLHKKAPTHGVRYAAVIGDEDSSSMKHIREKVNTNVEKFSDFGHLKRIISKKLETIHKQHKSLTLAVRTDFVKNFSYAYHQNKDKNEQSMINAISNIVPHMYGNHETCGDWCRYKKVDCYRHSGLPRGNDLKDIPLRNALEQLVQPFINNPKKLLTTGHSQANESLNNVAWSKAPKIRNYNGSESFDFRCAAAVCQFNEGTSYVTEVINQSGLSPQVITDKHSRRKDIRRTYFKEYKTENSHKRRRVELKNERSKKQVSNELREGTTYQSNCAFDDNALDTEEILEKNDSVQHISPEKIESETPKEIFYDLETTKLGYDAEIIQLSAYVDEHFNFNRYIMPLGAISFASTKITNLSIKVENGSRQMIKDGQVVKTVTVSEGLIDFAEWLKSIDHISLLLAHNGRTFDMPLLLKSFIDNGLNNSIPKHILGFVDTLPIFKVALPGKPSYKLSELHEGQFDHHNAMADVRALAALTQSTRVSSDLMSNHSFTIASAFEYVQNRFKTLHSFRELEQILCLEGTISKSMARKIANSGLRYSHLKLAHQRNCKSGIYSL